MIRRHLPLLIPPKPLGGSALSFSPISFTSFISFPSCFLRTLPFSVHNIFPSKLFAFNPFRTLSEKHGGGYQLFPHWNSKSSARYPHLHPTSSNPFCSKLLRTLLRFSALSGNSTL